MDPHTSWVASSLLGLIIVDRLGVCLALALLLLLFILPSASSAKRQRPRQIKSSYIFNALRQSGHLRARDAVICVDCREFSDPAASGQGLAFHLGIHLSSAACYLGRLSSRAGLVTGTPPA